MAIVYNTATTLNGFIADEHNSLQWLFNVPGSTDAEADMATFLDTIGSVIMGSTTYEWLLEEMKLLDNPTMWTDSYGDRPVWVFSSRLLPVPDGLPITVINANILDALPQITSHNPNGTDIWVMGGGDLAGQFFDAGALDRIILTIAPVFLPAGKPTLPRRIESDRLRTVSVREVGQFTEITLETIVSGDLVQ